MRIPLLEVTCVADHDTFVCFVAGKLRADGVLACWSHAFDCESDWAARYLREEIIGQEETQKKMCIYIRGGEGKKAAFHRLTIGTGEMMVAEHCPFLC